MAQIFAPSKNYAYLCIVKQQELDTTITHLSPTASRQAELMKKSIDTLIEGVAHDNADYINTTIANYLIESAESEEFGWNWFFDADEIEENGEPTADQIGVVKDYLNKYWDITADEIA